MVTSKEIGKKFREERERQGLTIAEASVDSRIHQKVLKDIENGIFDRIGGIYIKSFIKKYSMFLEMNTGEILKLYNDVSEDSPKKEFDIDRSMNKDDSEDFLASNTKTVQYVFITILSVVLISLLFIFIGMLKSRIAAKDKSSLRSASSDLKTTEVASVSPKKKTGFFGISNKNNNFSLELKAKGDVWMQIKKGEELVFAGILKDGQTKSWKLDEPVKLWTGKAENLYYVIDGEQLGTISKGVVKNIIISGNGIKIGNEWAVQTGQRR